MADDTQPGSGIGAGQVDLPGPFLDTSGGAPVLPTKTAGGVIPVRYVAAGANVVPVQTVASVSVGVLDVREVTGPANVTPVAETAAGPNVTQVRKVA